MGAGGRGGPGRARRPMGVWGGRWRRARRRPGRGRQARGPLRSAPRARVPHRLPPGPGNVPPLLARDGARGHLPERGAAPEPGWAGQGRAGPGRLHRRLPELHFGAGQCRDTGAASSLGPLPTQTVLAVYGILKLLTVRVQPVDPQKIVLWKCQKMVAASLRYKAKSAELWMGLQW